MSQSMAHNGRICPGSTCSATDTYTTIRPRTAIRAYMTSAFWPLRGVMRLSKTDSPRMPTTPYQDCGLESKSASVPTIPASAKTQALSATTWAASTTLSCRSGILRLQSVESFSYLMHNHTRRQRRALLLAHIDHNHLVAMSLKVVDDLNELRGHE